MIELEGSNEAMPARGAPNSPHSPRALIAEEEAGASRHQAGTRRSVPAIQAHEMDNQRKPLLHPSAMSATDAEGEGGHPCGSPLAPPTKVNTGRSLPERATRRSRWASSLPAVSTAPPQGVDQQAGLRLIGAAQPAPQVTRERRLSMPLPHRPLRSPSCKNSRQLIPRHLK